MTEVNKKWKAENTASKPVLIVENMTSKTEQMRSLMDAMIDVILVQR